MSKHKTICITGAGAGIGRGTLLHFHGLGWRVAALDKDEAALAELAQLLPEERCLTAICDVGEEGQIKQAFHTLTDWLDGDPLTCLVNNAGIADPFCGPLEELSLAAWRRWMDASLTAAFLCSREALPLLRRAEGANIVNISSTRSRTSEKDTFAYSAAKGGLDALTHSMAVSLGPQIRVNAILPGWIATQLWQKEGVRGEPDLRPVDHAQHPAGRVGAVEDIARTIEWLVGAGFVTGEQVVVDGGMTRKMIYAD